MAQISPSKRPYLGQTGGWLLFWITLACTTDMMMFGYDQGVFSGVVVTEDFLKTLNLEGPSRTTMLSTVAAIYDIGCFVGAMLAFTIGERFGRKSSILLGTSVMAIGVILMTSAFSLPQMFVGRIILGIGNGINTATAPVWQCETAPTKWRGKLVMFEMVVNVAGYTVVNWINYGLSFKGGALAWRLPLALQFFFIFVLFTTVPWLPESPRWLLAHGEEDEATQVIAALEGKSLDDPYVLNQKAEIIFSVNYEREHQVKWRDLFSSKHDGTKHDGTKPLRRLLLGAGTQFIQQFEGINIMGYYFPTVLIHSVGLSNETARLVSAVNSVTYLIFSIPAVLLIEKWGRRTLMMISTAAQGTCFLIICVLIRYGDAGNGAAATASIPFFFLFFISFAAGMLGIPWLYPTEINSLNMRTKGAAVATATNWITNYIIVQITPIGIQNLGWRFWIVFTCFNAAFLPVIYFIYPETANRSLEDIDEYYRHDPPFIVAKDPNALRNHRHSATQDEEQKEVAKEIMTRQSSIKTDVQQNVVHVDDVTKIRV